MKNRTRIFASTFGAIMAAAGLEHGIGEILQGNVAPQGLMIQSWPDSSFFQNLAGEPALTIIPNLLVTGILTVILSLALLVTSIGFAHRRHGGWWMIVLSLTLLLVGGGIFPPIFGMLVGAIATRIPAAAASPARRPRARQSFLPKLWPYSYGVCVFSWLALMPVGYLWGESFPEAILAVMFLALVTLGLTAAAGFARDQAPSSCKLGMPS